MQDIPRSQSDCPRQTQKRGLKNRWLKGTFGMILLLVVLASLAACGGEPKVWATAGRTLELHVKQPELVERVAFVDGQGDHRVVRPRASNRQLAVVNITIVNRTSTIIPMLVGPDAAQLGDRRGERVDAIDPFERGIVVDSTDLEEEDRFVPLLWGQVELERNFQVSGWMIFDVPKGLTLGTLWWEEVDSMLSDYVDYTRNR